MANQAVRGRRRNGKRNERRSIPRVLILTAR